ncbi:putative ketoamine kinase [Apilactobacillus kunkeei]|uniref:fructosamine kinase family protein n=1 Tax=Apilactobacillus kunkeei TaxID=148814 RepID=UPI0006CE63F7|nr:fructosamine kinase family protein [Apilactobacillus kunkeei]KPN82876.1 uncharacterized protein RZ77_12120 [Apilactobacillus kunkeei]MCK8619583.1 fructosamine kinase family protein [Apilactobacillus kunkeei]MCK8625967.1 fructosamine kinase family protein [Apilactobacillus kunkeei]MCK8634927.1 fructosamine kinase family protein [Apilactobacillus kunkeei]CAI2603189.1 putative ketoamine kinase [Apilactobacillus kunkeei]
MKQLTQEWLEQLPIKNVTKLTPVSGGDINDSYEIIADNQKYFMKVQPNKGKEFFEHEVEGIDLIGQYATVPTIIDYGEIDGDGFLIQKWMNLSPFGNQYQLGQMLANVHMHHNDRFGLDKDFKLGRVPKTNTWHDNWADFFIKQRLNPLMDMAIKNREISKEDLNHFDNLKKAFKKDMDSHHSDASLLHGDLWSGNFSFLEDGNPILIDPDVYYGDREFDIGVTTVFGGFNADFYEGYNDTYPLDSGWKRRIQYYQFFYLLAHYVMFGGGYGLEVKSILSQY